MTGEKPDPRLAKTVGEACANGDGTYDAYRLFSWLSRVVGGGDGISVEEVKQLADEVKERRRPAGDAPP